MSQTIPYGVILFLVFGVILIKLSSDNNNVAEVHRIKRQTQGAEKVGCRLPPPQQNGTFRPSRRRCPPGNTYPQCQMVEGSPVPHNWPLYNSCDPGYILNDTSMTASVCLDGQWQPALPICFRTCPPLRSPEVGLICVFGGQQVSCDSNVRPGTVAKCDQFYQTNLEMSCLDNGSWTRLDRLSHRVPEHTNHTVLRCVAECGLPSEVTNTRVNPATSDAKEVNSSSEHPWVVGIYINLKNEPKYKIKCVGSLITTRVVITGYSCFTPGEQSRREFKKELKVGLGKIYKDFYKMEKSSEIIEVDNVVYDNDAEVAVLRLVRVVRVSASVMPVCLPPSDRYSALSSSVLTVTGWPEDGEKIVTAKCPWVFIRQVDTATLSYNYDTEGLLYPDMCGSEATYEVTGRHFLMGYVVFVIKQRRETISEIYLKQIKLEEIKNILRTI